MRVLDRKLSMKCVDTAMEFQLKRKKKKNNCNGRFSAKIQIRHNYHLLACVIIRNEIFQKTNGRKYLQICWIDGHVHDAQISADEGS